MKTLILLLASALLHTATASERSANTIILDETGVKNLRLETVLLEESTLEETIFALGRIEVYPGRSAAISSRISGRALEVLVKNDHPIKKGDVAIVVESRQPGNPPPHVSMTAPISGLVSATNIIPGEPVEPESVLARILDLTEVYAMARVPEHLAGHLRSRPPTA